MAIQYVSGDLFWNRFGAEALAQGCNCQGFMSAGIAVGFKERYPVMYAEYRRRCKAKPREFNIGDVFLWKEDGKPAVFNLATQEDFWHSRATYSAVDATLARMKQVADDQGIQSIAVPRIGAGSGGLLWNKCQAILEQVFEDWTGTVYVYVEFLPEEEPTP